MHIAHICFSDLCLLFQCCQLAISQFFVDKNNLVVEAASDLKCSIKTYYAENKVSARILAAIVRAQFSLSLSFALSPGEREREIHGRGQLYSAQFNSGLSNEQIGQFISAFENFSSILTKTKDTFSDSI